MNCWEVCLYILVVYSAKLYLLLFLYAHFLLYVQFIVIFIICSNFSQSPKLYSSVCANILSHNNVDLKFIAAGLYKSSTSSISTSPLMLNSQSVMSGDTNLSKDSTVSLMDLPLLTPEEALLVAKAEVALMKEEGEQELPSHVTDKQWQDIVSCKSIHTRRRLLRFLFLNEIKKQNEKLRKKEKAELAEIRWVEQQEMMLENKHLQYGLWYNTIFLKLTIKTIKSVLHHKLMNARLYGQPIVFDNSYENLMNHLSKKDLVRQLTMGLSLNREHADPFYIHICNFNLEDESSKLLLQSIPTLLDTDYPLDTHSVCYQDVFPHDKLVYLTPHCDEEMMEFDHDAIYIVGSLVDRVNTEPVSLAKAKRQQLRMQKFPLDRYQ